MGTQTADRTKRVELYLRAAAPEQARHRQDAVIERLEDGAENEAFELDVSHWPKRIPMDPAESASPFREAINAFRAWARAQDKSLWPAVGTRACWSWDTVQRYMTISLPVMLLAVYDDGKLTSVYPHTDDEDSKTVEDGVDDLLEPAAKPSVDDGQVAVVAE